MGKSRRAAIRACRCRGRRIFAIRRSVVQSWEVAFEDTEIGGYPIAEGEAVFPLEPVTMIPPDSSIQMTLTYRERTIPITFSLGPHHCMGSALARMEVSIILEALATKMPSMSLAGQRNIVAGHGGVRGPESLQVQT